MRILVTNDDGWDAPGMELLFRVACEFGEAHSSAPLEKRSGCGHQLTFDRALTFESCGKNRWNVDGMPADCVRLGVSRLGSFDWVLSGVNDGANLGVDTFISGTVAAAREAMTLGIPAIAISQYRRGMGKEFDWSIGAGQLRQVLSIVLNLELPTGRFWNVNLPDEPKSRSNGSAELVFCEPDPSPLPMDYRHYESTSEYSGRYHDRARVSGLDIDSCFSGKVSITML